MTPENANLPGPLRQRSSRLDPLERWVSGASAAALGCWVGLLSACTESPPTQRASGAAGERNPVANEALARAKPTRVDVKHAPVGEPSAATDAGLGGETRVELDAELSPPLVAADATALPQTSDLPSLGSSGLRLRLERLVAAIAHDDPQRARPAFFPVVAYQQVKAIQDPERDWQARLVRAFERDIHDYHRMLGREAAGAQLVGLVSSGRAPRWMAPGSEGNRVGYYRMTRSRLRIRLADGAERDLELTSLISWRGAWYVVHLHGFA
jgi:hypothetical protein